MAMMMMLRTSDCGSWTVGIEPEIVGSVAITTSGQ